MPTQLCRVEHMLSHAHTSGQLICSHTRFKAWELQPIHQNPGTPARMRTTSGCFKAKNFKAARGATWRRMNRRQVPLVPRRRHKAAIRRLNWKAGATLKPGCELKYDGEARRG